jgi:hypothetical protein
MTNGMKTNNSIDCDICGGHYTSKSYNKHLTTKLHIDSVENKRFVVVCPCGGSFDGRYSSSSAQHNRSKTHMYYVEHNKPKVFVDLHYDKPRNPKGRPKKVLPTIISPEPSELPLPRFLTEKPNQNLIKYQKYILLLFILRVLCLHKKMK